MSETPTPTFQDFDLPEAILSALSQLGYETPTPVQARSIPVLLNGGDLSAQAQTGTGKTAAFALPILAQIDVKLDAAQALVIVPTRELAIQVAEAFQSYASHLKGFHVSPIYGGQDYKIQLRAIKRGAHVIVGTPGRLMDHLRRGSLPMQALKTIVLDEADEMLKMGFIDDVEWILEQLPKQHQTALFSATMPDSIKKIAKRYLKEPERIEVKSKERSVKAIQQSVMRVNRNDKLDVLTRYLEVEDIQAVIIFARTRNISSELSEKLQARGYGTAALHGDLSQAQRKRVMDQLKNGAIDIIVATDLAARGIDVDRISHVINFDIPCDSESYIHRIGRTGRAGREGKALLFVTPREGRMLKDIERTIGHAIEVISPPTAEDMQMQRDKQLADTVTNIISKSKKLAPYRKMIENVMQATACEAEDVAAALAYYLQQKKTPTAAASQMSSYADREDGGGRRGGRDKGKPKRFERFERFSRDEKSGEGSGFKKKRPANASSSGRQRSYAKTNADEGRSSSDKPYGKSKGYGKPADKKTFSRPAQHRKGSSSFKGGASKKKGQRKAYTA